MNLDLFILYHIFQNATLPVNGGGRGVKGVQHWEKKWLIIFLGLYFFVSQP